MNYAKNALDLIGNTPLVRINALNEGKALVLAKMESRNPGGSSKDRIGIAMIEAAEARGDLRPGALIIEPTSGNTGIGLALAAAIKGYRLILTMPDSMSIERRKLLAAFGAELVLTDGALGMAGAIAEAEKLRDANPGAWIPQQFENPDNCAAHRKSTAEEIWRDTDGKIDVFVAGVGTGGTLSGVAGVLKERRPEVQIVAVEPADSPRLTGGNAAPHKLQGIGANFIPSVLDVKRIDRVFDVRHEDAGRIARLAAKREGLLIGISGGAALFAALELAKEEKFAGKTIVALMPDSGERYLSSWLFDEAYDRHTRCRSFRRRRPAT
ncbi:MAG: cysteine synthase A, partial [Victivallaceae bacterium]|nr:cysteine synthase A [Victivallaceae bacterium]